MIAVTAASGQLGQLVIDNLLKRNINPKDIVAIVRNEAKGAAFQSKGIQVRVADYESKSAFEKALSGVSRLLLISGMDIGKRIEQHQNIIEAAQSNHIKWIAYTSILNANKSKMILAAEHLATEELIKKSGLSYSILRNGWYIENYFMNLSATLQSGMFGSAQNGKISGATRADLASAASEVIVNPAMSGTIYELGGEGFTMTDFANELMNVSQKKLSYTDLPAQDYEKLLLKLGLPAGLAHVLSDSDLGISRGELYTESRDLEKLLKSKPTTYQQAIKHAFKYL